MPVPPPKVSPGRLAVVRHGQGGPAPAQLPPGTTDAWQALGEVYAGLHEARHLPDAPAGNAGRVLAGLRDARDNADRAAALATTTRLRLTVAADRLRRTGAPAALVAARRFTAAIARLDLVSARLAVGGQAIDRYAAALTHAASPPRLALPAPPRPPAGPLTEITAGGAAARLAAPPGATPTPLDPGTTPATHGGTPMNNTTAALKDLITGRLRAHDQRLRGFSEPDWQRYADLLGGAFLLAVRRRFSSGQDHASVIRFVASVRERYDLNGHDIDPGIAEALVRAALGDREPVPTTASAVTAQTLLVLGLLEDEGMPQPELADFLDAATAHAVASDCTGDV